MQEGGLPSRARLKFGNAIAITKISGATIIPQLRTEHGPVAEFMTIFLSLQDMTRIGAGRPVEHGPHFIRPTERALRNFRSTAREIFFDICPRRSVSAIGFIIL